MDSAEKLRRIIEASGLTQEVLAARVGVSFASLNAWVNGRARPRQKAVLAIDALYTELVGGSSLDEEKLAELIALAEAKSFNSNQLVEDRQLLDALTLTMTYHTDAIEGSTMTVADTEAVLFEGRSLSGRTLVEQLEAKNHQAALWWLVDEAQRLHFDINEDLVLELHARLMNGIMSDAGRYRQHAVRIAGTRVTVANYLRVPELIRELCVSKLPKNGSPVAFLANHHAHFERIHPFGDGNGRVGRLLLLALALRHKIVPPIIFRERRVVYYKALEAAQVNEDHIPLQQFIAESILAASREVFQLER